jgi:hypothetical protein
MEARAVRDEIVRCKEGKLWRVIYATAAYLFVKPHGGKRGDARKLRLDRVADRAVKPGVEFGR